MPHIQITSDGFWVDGTRVDVHADDLQIDFGTVPPTVRCTFAPDVLDVDLPESAIYARAAEQAAASAQQLEQMNSTLAEMRDRLAALDAQLEAVPSSVGREINKAARGGRRGGSK